MTTREVDLIIKARDQASQIAKDVTNAFNGLVNAQNQVGQSASGTTSLIERLKSELQALSTQAQGIGAFGKVASDIDRAGNTIQKFAQQSARANEALVDTSLKASQAATSYKLLQEDAAAAATALNSQKAQLAAAKAEQDALNNTIAAAGARYTQLRSQLQATTAPSDALRQSVRDQRDALISLVEQQLRQNTVVNGQKAAVQAASANYKQLSRDVTQAGRDLRTANIGFEGTALAAREQAAALELAEQEYAKLRTSAAATSQALGGVEASQEAIVAASQRSAQTIAQLSQVLQNEQAKLRAASVQTLSADQANTAQALSAAYRQEVAATQAAKQAWDNATKSVQALAAQMRATKTPTAQLQADFTLAKVAAQEAKTAYETQAASLEGLRGVVQRQAAARTQEKAAVDAARTAADRYNNSLVGMIRNFVGLRNPAQQAAVAIERAAAAQTRANRTANLSDAARFQRTQNLAFQINDLVTQLASGTSLTRALGQQAGQFAQLSPTFNSFLVTLLRFVPLLAVIAAAISPVVVAFVRLGETATSIRQFNVQLAGTQQASEVSARALASTVTALTEYGLKVEDARKVTATFLQEGLDPQAFQALGEAVATVSRAIGQEAPDAAKALSEALHGTSEDVLRLDNQTHILTNSERIRIIQLGEAATAQEAQNNATQRAEIVSAAYQRRADAIAQQSRGPWSSAFHELGLAFNEVVRAISNSTVLQAFGRGLDILAEKARNFAHDFRTGFQFLTHLGEGGAAAVANVNAADQRNAAAGDPRSAQAVARAQAEAEARVTNQLRDQARLRQQQLAVAHLGRVEGAGQQAVFDAQNEALAQGVTLTEQQTAAIRSQAEALARAQQTRREGIRDADSLITRQRTFNLELQKEIAARATEARLIGETQRQQAIDRAADAAVQRAAQQRVSISAQQLQDVKDSAAALFDAQQAESNRNDLIQQRIQLDELLHNGQQSITVEEQLQNEALLSNIDLTSAAGQAWENMRRQVIETTRQIAAAQEAQQHVTALAGQLAEAQRELAQAQRDGETQAQLDARIAAIQALQQQLIAARDAAIQMAQAIGGTTGQQMIDALNRVNTTVNTTRESLLTAAQASQMLAQGISGAIDGATEHLANAIDGTESWGDAINGVRDAFLQFAADFLRQIAQMIIQALILKAIQSSGIGGGIAGFVGALTKHGGGVVGSGGFHRKINPLVFANAPKFHAGGVAGLASNEVPAILQKGEEVLTKTDPRHVANAAGAQGNGVRIVNVFDAADVLQSALGRTAGEQVLMNFVRENASGINAALGRSK